VPPWFALHCTLDPIGSDPALEQPATRNIARLALASAEPLAAR